MSSRRELAVGYFGGKANERQTMGTLNHEAFHQYIFYALQEQTTPPWFNEGHADLFASVKKVGSKLKLIEDPYHMRRLSPLFARGAVNLEKHISLDYQGFYNNIELNYPLAWSIIYYLRKSAPLYKDKRYSKILSITMAEVAKGSDIKTINEKAFYGIDMKDFQRDFLKFWNSKKMRSKAARNYIIPK